MNYYPDFGRFNDWNAAYKVSPKYGVNPYNNLLTRRPIELV